MTPAPAPPGDQPEIARLQKRAERERRARMEAEALAERGTRLLYEQNRQMKLLYSIADASACAATVGEALQVTLDELCAYMEWPLGHAYLVSDRPGGLLVSAKCWHLDHPEQSRAFQAVSEGMTFRSGEGLPGRALERGEPIWVADVTVDANFPRGELAREIGVRGAFAVPVLVGKVVVAVLEAFSREVAEPRENWAAICAQVGIQLGRIFEREERKEADRASQAKSEFLSRMSHELRTPLNAILGFGQLLEYGQLTPDQRSGIAHILKGGRHLLSLIDEVLDISRIEAGHMNVSPEPVAVLNVLREVLDLIRPLAEQGNVHLIAHEGSVGCCYVMADRQRLRQILINLLSNAVKYNRAGGHVVVQCAERDGRIRLSVRDNGLGLPAHKLEKLFIPFERLGAEQSGVEGTGLGLALSKRLAELMGGSLGVESEPGQGSTFWVELAATEGPLEQAAAGLQELKDQPGQEEPVCTLLYVEDNYPNLQLVQQVLSLRPGIKLISAMHAVQGLEMAIEHQPGLILLDLNLPDMNGDEALLRLQQHPATSQIPVVIVSADATPGQIRRLLAAGAVAYLTKPINLPQFLQTLDDLIPKVRPLRDAAA